MSRQIPWMGCLRPRSRRSAPFGAEDTPRVDFDAEVPGTIGEEDGAIVLSAEAGGGRHGLADEIARRALASGATALAARPADIPGGGPLAAILRHPV